MKRKDNILSKQNPFYKVLISIALVIISSLVGFHKFLLIFGITFIYLCVYPAIYIIWLQTILKIIPFFISLFILGIIFQISFISQCFLSVRILYLLLISVYLTETSSLDSFITSGEMQPSRIRWKFMFFLAATVHFIPMLINKFKKNIKVSRNLINIINSSLEECLLEINDVETTVIEKMQNDHIVPKVSFSADVYLLLLLVIQLFLLFI